MVITPQERLKRLMKAQLDKQCLYYYMKYEFLNFNIIINFKLDKLDKKAENDRLERRKIEQRERKEEFDKLSRLYGFRFCFTFSFFLTIYFFE